MKTNSIFGKISSSVWRIRTGIIAIEVDGERRGSIDVRSIFLELYDRVRVAVPIAIRVW